MTEIKQLESELQWLYQSQKRISKIIENAGLRFSINKFTADLGEYYAFKALSEAEGLFQSVEQEPICNSDYDLIGIPANQSPVAMCFGHSPIRIEVKTRRNQKGSKYLSGVKPNKFDLLCVVDMAIDYSLNQIYLVDSKVAHENLDLKRGRLIFRDFMSFHNIKNS